MSEVENKDTPEQAGFRAYCRDWLANNSPEPPPVQLPRTHVEISSQEQMGYLSAWQKSLYEAGLVGCDYPIEYGGGGRTNCQAVANMEMVRAKTPFLVNSVAMRMAAPTILHHGSEELKKRLLPTIFSSEEIWCQGFSEPSAGSDLANVQTFAEKRGDGWIINGQKIWTTMGKFASWMILLCRHDKSVKHAGLTYFVVHIQPELGKSVEVRPLIKMTGETGFNEIFFTDFVVSDKYRLDEVGKGWEVAQTTLLYERGAGSLVAPSTVYSITEFSKETSKAMKLIDLARESDRDGKTAADDPVIRDRIMKLCIREKGKSESFRRAHVKGLTEHPLRIPQQGKLIETELEVDIGALAVEIEGAGSTLYTGDQNAPAGGEWPLSYLAAQSLTIGGGTSEVLRNILGDRVLGMAKTK